MNNEYEYYSEEQSLDKTIADCEQFLFDNYNVIIEGLKALNIANHKLAPLTLEDKVVIICKVILKKNNIEGIPATAILGIIKMLVKKLSERSST